MSNEIKLLWQEYKMIRDNNSKKFHQAQRDLRDEYETQLAQLKGKEEASE